jgi:hypothetical protein
MITWFGIPRWYRQRVPGGRRWCGPPRRAIIRLETREARYRLEVRSTVTGNPAEEVERLEPWQLPAYLEALERRGVAEVTWNRETITLATAADRAGGVSPSATVVVDGTAVYVAEPDHSADDPPPQQTVPIQLTPRRKGARP